MPSERRQRLNRRRFLTQLGVGLGGLVALSACQPAAPPPVVPTAGAAPQPTAAPTAQPTAAAASIKRGGALTWAEIADPISFDPHTRNNASASNVQRLVYESFTRMEPRTMNVQPALATSWQYTSPTELVFTLRQGVTFHNGQSFSADDAKWNVDRMIDPATGNPFGSWYAAIGSTSVVDKKTLKLTLKSPDPVLPEKFRPCA